MGQISSPVLNRTGYSTFWQSVWDDKYNYNRGWKEDYYIRKLLPYIFTQKTTLSKYLLNEQSFKKNHQMVFDKTLFVKTNAYFFIQDFKKILARTRAPKPYILRVWIIKFNSWVILFFTIYTPVKGKAHLLKQKPSYKKAGHLGLYHLQISTFMLHKGYLKLENLTHSFD